jgi:hypothetical protein
MSDETPAPELIPDPVSPPTFDEAVRTGVQRLQDAIAAFEDIAARIPEEAYHEAEAKVLESTAAELQTLVDAGQIDFESAAYDSQAWYHIVEDLQRVASKLYDAVFLMRDVEKRIAHKEIATGGEGGGTAV